MVLTQACCLCNPITSRCLSSPSRGLSGNPSSEGDSGIQPQTARCLLPFRNLLKEQTYPGTLHPGILEARKLGRVRRGVHVGRGVSLV